MKRRNFLTAVSAPLLLPPTRGIAQQEPRDPSKHVRDYCLETELSPTTAAIVAPAGPDWTEAAEALSRKLSPECGGRLDTRVAAEEDGRWPVSPRHLILLGNAIRNPLLLRLYLNHYTLVDEHFPGPGGVMVHSVHNPFGDGRNAIVVGASNSADIMAGADALAALVREKGPRLGFTLLNQSPQTRRELPPKSDFQHGLKSRKEQIEKGDLPWPVMDYGMLYYLTGQPEWAHLFRDLHLHGMRVARESGTWPATVFNNYFYLYRVLEAWDLIEESPVFSSDDRLQLTTLFLEVARYVADLPYFKGKLALGNNHQTYAALSCYMAHRYFQKYYGWPEFNERQDRVKSIFAMHNASWRPNDNEEGTSVRTHRHLVNYSLMRGDYTYFSTGRARRLADWIVMVTDNRADTMPFGDAGEYDGSYRGGPKRIQAQRSLALLSFSAWYYRDPRYAWARDWYRKGLNWSDRFDFDQLLSKTYGWQQRYGIKEWEFYTGWLYRELPRQEPAHLLGVVAARLDEGARVIAKAQDAPQQELFDKLTFRSGFRPADEYLAIEGITTLPHSHDDANCIMRLSWKDRLWIVEGDEHKGLRRYHNGMVILCKGEHHTSPHIARSRVCRMDGDWGFSRTVLPDDNGLDWERSIFWRKGRFFVVWDRLKATRDGDYSVECLWHTLGDVKLEGRELHVEQDGERFLIQNFDGSDLSLSFRGCLYQPDREAYRTYEHAKDGYMRVFRESQRRRLRAGEELEYVNLLQVSSGNPAARITGTAEGLLRIEDVRTFYLRAGAFGSDALSVAEHAETSALRPAPVRSSPAVRHAAPDQALRWKAAAGAEPTAMHVDGGTIAVGTKAGSLHLYDSTGSVKASQNAGAAVSSVRLLEGGRVAYGARDGSLAIAERTGQIQWTRRLGHGIRQRLRVPSALLEFEGDLIAGLEDETLFRFGTRGEEVWHAQSQYHAVTTLGRIDIASRPHILVGSEYYAMNLFDEKGTLLWVLRLGPTTAVGVADLDGDGQQEILYAEWQGIHAVRPRDSSVMWNVNMGGEVLGAVPVIGNESADTVAASDAGQVTRVAANGTPKWRLDAGEPLTSMAVNGGRLGLGCLSGRIELRRLADGQIESAAKLDSAVLRLAALADGFVGATEDGTVFAL